MIDPQTFAIRCPSVNLDAAASAFLLRDLEHRMAETYDIQYPELQSRALLPPGGGVDPGAQTIVYEQFDRVGNAKIISNFADELPRADVKGLEFRTGVKLAADSYGWNIDEAMAAGLARRPLTAMKGQSARDALEFLLDEIAFVGSAADGLSGFLNHSSVTPSNVATVSAATAWDSAGKLADPDAVLRDLNEPIDEMIRTTRGRETPDTVLLPPEKHSYISQKRLTDRDATILSHFLKTNPYIKQVLPCWRLEGAGAGETDRMVVYKKDARKLGLAEPVMFTQLPPQERGLEIIVPCYAKTAGVIMPYPGSVAFRDGI